MHCIIGLPYGRHNSAGGIIPAKIPFARLSSRAKASCLPIQLLAHMRVRIFIRWSSQPKPTASIRIATSPGCSSGCLWQRRPTTTTRCFPGSCRPTYADPRSHHTSRAPTPELRGVADGPHTIEPPHYPPWRLPPEFSTPAASAWRCWNPR